MYEKSTQTVEDCRRAVIEQDKVFTYENKFIWFFMYCTEQNNIAKQENWAKPSELDNMVQEVQTHKQFNNHMHTHTHTKRCVCTHERIPLPPTQKAAIKTDLACPLKRTGTKGMYKFGEKKVC